MTGLFIIGFVLLCTLPPSAFLVLHILGKRDDKKQREFERQFAIEQRERDEKVFQAKLEGNMTIDKLEEIYYPKQQSNGNDKQ